MPTMDTTGTSTDLFVGGTPGKILHIGLEQNFVLKERGNLPRHLLCVSE
jgi:hypothetical protein